jgi:hypothetical protein
MSQTLINAIRKARQTRITAGKYTFTIRRPTVYEYLNYRVDSGEKDAEGKPIYKIFIPVEDLSKFVSDWSGVTGIDLASSADGNPVPFDPDLFMLWVVDHPDIWTALINGILAAFNSYIAARDESSKN